MIVVQSELSNEKNRDNSFIGESVNNNILNKYVDKINALVVWLKKRFKYNESVNLELDSLIKYLEKHLSDQSISSIKDVIIVLGNFLKNEHIKELGECSLTRSLIGVINWIEGFLLSIKDDLIDRNNENSKAIKCARELFNNCGRLLLESCEGGIMLVIDSGSVSASNIFDFDDFVESLDEYCKELARVLRKIRRRFSITSGCFSSGFMLTECQYECISKLLDLIYFENLMNCHDCGAKKYIRHIRTRIDPALKSLLLLLSDIHMPSDKRLESLKNKYNIMYNAIDQYKEELIMRRLANR